MADDGLSFLEGLTLAALFFEAPKLVKPSQLAETFGTTRGNVSHCISSLEAKGLLQRKIDPEDARAYQLTLKPPGKKCALRVIAAFDRLQKEFESEIGKAALSEMLRSVRKLEARRGNVESASSGSHDEVRKLCYSRYILLPELCASFDDALFAELSCFFIRDSVPKGIQMQVKCVSLLRVMKSQSIFAAQSISPLRITYLLPALVLVIASLVQAQAPVPDSPAIEAKAHAWVQKLTLEQKVELVGGVDEMYTHPAPSIDLPRFKMSDASVGVRTWGPTTAYAGGVALAATWDTDFARKLGAALGKDARARSVNFLLGPGVNIARSPIAGRNFEYLSEDPYLNATIVVPYIEGVQSQGVIATVKHYAINNQEYNRHNVSSDVDERTMREIYFPAFEAAVTKGHVDAVMNSYNLINGVHATQNEFLNLKVLKGEWGFKGILMSDWDATYDTVGAANNGLDLEMPGPRFMNPKALLAAIHAGAIKESTIDDKLMRIFSTELRYGFVDRPQFDPSNSTYSVADRPVALQGALESITLLKNEGHLLPLDASKVKTIAILGPNAWPAVPGGGGSSEATAFDPVSTVTGIANLVGPSVHVLYARGLPEMNEVFWHTHWDGAIKVATYPSKDFTGTPETADSHLIADYKDEWWGPADKTPRSIRYTSSYKAEKAGKYLILAAASGDDQYTVTIDGKPLAWPPHAEGQAPEFWTIDLAAGQTVSVVADYLPGFVGVRFGLGIAYAPDLVSEDAKKFSSIADVVIVCAGFSPSTESEGGDRTFELPWGQDALIEAAAHANPHTIVTLTGGGGMETQPLARPRASAAARLLSRPGRRNCNRRGPLRQAQPRRQAPRQLRPQLGRQPLSRLLLPDQRRRHRPPRNRNRRQKSRLRDSARELWRQADGRLSLLDNNRQAPALSLRIRPELYDIQLFQARSSEHSRRRRTGHSQLRRNQHRQRRGRRSSPALRLRSIGKGHSSRARTERLRETPPCTRRNKTRDPDPRRPLLQLLGRSQAEVDHRPRQVRAPRRRLQREHAIDCGSHSQLTKRVAPMRAWVPPVSILRPGMLAA